MESSQIVFTENLFPATPFAGRYAPIGSIEVARQRLTSAIERAEGPGLIIGAPGTGKSLLCEVLREQFAGRFEVVGLAESRIRTRRSLFQHILHHLGLGYSHLSEGELRLSLLDHATRRKAEGGRGILLVVDEAQGLPGRLLEELRLLTGIVHQDEARVRLILCGSQTLDERLAHPRLEALSQRIAARCYLHPLNHQETGAYIRTLLDRAERTRWEIEDEAIRSAYFASDGIPRLLNQTMSLAVGQAIAAGTQRITSIHVDQAWVSLQQLPGPSHTMHPLNGGHADIWGDNERAADAEPPGTGSVEFGLLDEPTLDDADSGTPKRHEHRSDHSINLSQPPNHDPMADTVDYEPPLSRFGGDDTTATDQKDSRQTDIPPEETFDEHVESDVTKKVVRSAATTEPRNKPENLRAVLFGDGFEDEIELAVQSHGPAKSSGPLRSSGETHQLDAHPGETLAVVETYTATPTSAPADVSQGTSSVQSECCGTPEACTAPGSCCPPRACNDVPEIKAGTLRGFPNNREVVAEDKETAEENEAELALGALSEELSIHQQVVALNRETACQAGITLSTVSPNSAASPKETLRYDSHSNSHAPNGAVIESFEFHASSTDADLVDLIDTDEPPPECDTVSTQTSGNAGQPVRADISIRDDRDLLVIEEEIDQEAPAIFRTRPSVDEVTIADQRSLLDRMREA